MSKSLYEVKDTILTVCIALLYLHETQQLGKCHMETSQSSSCWRWEDFVRGVKGENISTLEMV